MKVFYPKWTRAVLLKTLKERTKRLQDIVPLSQVILFGSWARDQATASSDVDLLVVYRGEPRKEAYALVRRALDIRGLELHLYTEAEYAALEPTLERMTAGGVALFP